MDDQVGAPETKADLNGAFAEFMEAFETFRETNDQRLAQLEKKASTDAVTADKLARVEAALDANQRRMDELVLKSARPSLTGGEPAAASETKSAFDAYVRGGDASGLSRMETKALSGTPADAGFTVPIEIESEVMRRLGAISPIRSIAGVRQVSSGTYRKPITSAGPATGWVGETDPLVDTDAPTLSELSFDTMELYAMPAATSSQLDDSAVDLEQWLADEIETVFAEQETAAFVAGNGTAKPRGFTAYPTVAETSWEWGKIGTIKTGKAGGFADTNPADALIDLVYTLKAGYRQNAHFVMHRSTQAAVRKMKDSDGSYLWSPPAIPGARASLLNFPVVEAEDMPDIADGNEAIAFGDFRRGYLIVDRQGLRILRDPYSAKPYVLFYTTKRVGGGVQDFDAIKMLTFAA
jgi:HK97 family phage major capsid protein